MRTFNVLGYMNELVIWVSSNWRKKFSAFGGIMDCLRYCIDLCCSFVEAWINLFWPSTSLSLFWEIMTDLVNCFRNLFLYNEIWCCIVWGAVGFEDVCTLGYNFLCLLFCLLNFFLFCANVHSQSLASVTIFLLST